MLEDAQGENGGKKGLSLPFEVVHGKEADTYSEESLEKDKGSP